jgi:Kef-type K+ transport system membrane component KefB/Trk K+ transport system NAD-binding subunit
MNLDPFSEIGVLIAVATIISLIMRFLKQPLIVGHIITGFLVGHYALGIFQSMEMLELFSHLGIAFLLFSVGLNLNPKVLKQYGIASVLNTFGQVFLTGGVGVLVCMLLGYGWITSLYVGIAISFSSTVIVLKLLSDKGDLDKLYVKVSIGSLLLQDLIAILLLFGIPIMTGSSGGGGQLLTTLGWGIGAAVGVFLIANYVVRYLHPYLTRSQELLFLFANAWAIGIAILFSKIGFSLEGGALIAGVALSSLPSSHEISARLTPLRDFFIVTFFILLGTRMVVSDFQVILVPAIVLSLFVLIINPLIQLIIMGVLGYRKKTSFQTGMMAAQISEFSLILVGLGVTLGQVSPVVLSTVTLVGIITIFVSTYFIFYSDKLYTYFAPILGIFERTHVRERAIKSEQRKIILIGGGRVSYDFIQMFKHEQKDFLVVDHDPEVLEHLKSEGVACEYGDATDPDFLEDMKLSKADLIISTSPDLETNQIIISVAKRYEKAPLLIVVAHRINNALELYESGADYVILPHFLGGKFAASLLKRYAKGEVEIATIREKHIVQLQSRAEHGHEHPQIERLR